jgi:hypothetical protein
MIASAAGKARATSASSTGTIVNVEQPAFSSNGNHSNNSTAENSTSKKRFGNVGGKVGAIKPAPGLTQVKVAGQDNKRLVIGKGNSKDKGKDKVIEDSQDKQDKGAVGVAATAGPSTAGKISYAQILGS